MTAINVLQKFSFLFFGMFLAILLKFVSNMFAFIFEILLLNIK